MKKTPQGWPRISTSLYYEDPAKAIDWLCEAFGFEVRLKIEGDEGRIEHSELTYGDGLIMVSGAGPKSSKPGTDHRKSPRDLGGANTQNMMVFVDDVDAFCVHAREHGAKVLMEPTTSDYGDEYWVDRTCEIEDIGGHRWWFAQRLRGKKNES